jgi:hypothetical protein
MSDPIEQYPINDVVEQFGAHVADRKERLDYLAGSLEFALAAVADIETVNGVIEFSSRPELVMTQRVDQLELNGLQDLHRINNFHPSMQAFGIREFEEGETWDGKPEKRLIGRRKLNDEERSLFYLMGGRGDYHQFMAFAEENGVERKTASDMLLQSHVGHQAFMRMWILFPELTENLMDWCLDEVGNRYRSVAEEMFVAYSVMSKLVDINDADVIKESGEIDTWRLCR